MKYYTVYLNKNDKIVAFGDASQCAEQLKLSQGAAGFRTLLCRTKKGQLTKYAIVCEDVNNCDTSKEQLRNWDMSMDYIRGMSTKQIADKYNISLTPVQNVAKETKTVIIPLLNEWDNVCTSYRQRTNTSNGQ